MKGGIGLVLGPGQGTEPKNQCLCVAWVVAWCMDMCYLCASPLSKSKKKVNLFRMQRQHGGRIFAKEQRSLPCRRADLDVWGN